MLAKFLAVFIVLLGSEGFAGGVPEKYEFLRVNYYSSPPDVFETPEGPKGATVDVWERVAKRAGVKIQWQGPYPSLRAMRMLEKGDSDATARLAWAKEREEVAHYSDKPVFWGATGIIVLRSELLDRIASDEDVRGKRIAWVRGGVPPPFLERNKESLILESPLEDVIELNLAKLQKKQVWGLYFIFASTAQFALAKKGLQHEVKVLAFPGSEKPSQMYAGFSKKAHPVLVAKMKKAFNEELSHYDYEKLSQEYVNRAARGEFGK